MSFKFDPSAAEERKYITKAGTYDVKVTAWKADVMPPRADFYIRFTLVNNEGEAVFADIFKKAEKSGTYDRLNQFIASTATNDEIKKYMDRGEFEIDEDFLNLIAERSVGRRLRVVVTERKYQKKDGTEGVAYQGSFFRKHPDGCELPY
jgi:hypothetical protein